MLVAVSRTDASSLARTRAPENPAMTITVNRSEAPAPVETAAAIHRTISPPATHSTRRADEPGGMIRHPSRPEPKRPTPARPPPQALTAAAPVPAPCHAIAALPAAARHTATATATR